MLKKPLQSGKRNSGPAFARHGLFKLEFRIEQNLRALCFSAVTDLRITLINRKEKRSQRIFVALCRRCPYFARLAQR